MLRFLVCLVLASSFVKAASMQDMAKSQAREVGKELYDKFGLYPMDVTVNIKNGVDLIDLRLYSYQILEEREAEELIKCSGIRFLEQVNGNKKLRPYLSHYPFTKVSVRLYCFRDDLSEVPIGKVESAFYVAGESLVKLAR
ncbi:MAG: hypothetical protein SP1CHLAM54_07630 [Chlamydiia bacterium]|nr:hypothetical protein [Chlamydiia bacterium]MCH9615669.1 hypothetical protein [Chlamydiia bacterium]MCH9628928.1 hypothetical protein [Chlamydiia bacterium]